MTRGEPFEIAHFLKVVRQTAPALSAEQVAVLEAGLRTKPGDAGH